jgi:uncharacterized membrane protein YbhN (UPF0104 family)
MALLRDLRRNVPLVGGAIAVAFVLQHLGWCTLREAVITTGSWFAVVAVIDALAMACDAWAICGFVRHHSEISYWRVLVAQATGYAVNRVTPGSSLGEPIKVGLLMADIPRSVAISSIVLYNLATIMVGVVAIAIGTVALIALGLPGAEIVIWVSSSVLFIAMIAALVLVRRGLFTTLLSAATFIGLVGAARAAGWRVRFAEIDGQLRWFGDRASWRSLGFVCASRALNWLGTIALVRALGTPLSAPIVIGVTSLGILISWTSNLMPLGLGIADGGTYELYGVLGASPEAGLAFAMVNRARGCLLALVGLAIYAVSTYLSGRRISDRHVRGAARSPRGELATPKSLRGRALILRA